MRIGTDLYKELQNVMSAADKLLAVAIAQNKVGLADNCRFDYQKIVLT